MENRNSAQQFFKILMLLLAVLIFLMCISDNKKEQDKEQSSPDDYKLISDSIMGMVYSVPDPDEIFNEIFIDEFELKSDLINSLSSADQVFESKTIALNIGVYLADMAYLVLNEKNILAIEYFKTILKMSKNLGLSNFQSPDLLFNIEANINNKDTLYSIIKESINEIKDELEYTNRNKILVLIYTGSIVESLYLAVNNINYDDSKEIIEKILEQNIVIDNLYDFLSQYKEDPDIMLTIEQLDSIKYFMDKCKKGDSEISVRKDEQNHLIFKGGTEVVYNMANFESVKSRIIELRNVIIEN